MGRAPRCRTDPLLPLSSDIYVRRLENIGWCKPGTEGLYNICIMEELHSILALGAGGSTKLTNPATGKVVRLTNPKYPQQYMERIDQLCRDKAELVAFQRSL